MNNPNFPAFDPALLSQASQQMLDQFSKNLSQTMPQIADPNKWLAWFNPAAGQSVQAASSANAALNELGVKLEPAVLEKLQKEYTEQLAALWQDVLAARTPA